MNCKFVTLLQNFSNHARFIIEGYHITYFHHVNIIFWAKTVDVTLLHLCVTDHKTLS